MSISPSELYPLDDKQLLERLGGAMSGSAIDHAIQMEFQRRAFVATAEAAKATKETAQWTKWATIATAISAVVAAGSLVTALWTIVGRS